MMIDYIAKNFVQPVLKQSGFRKKSLNWFRTRAEFIDVVSLQKAKYSTAEVATFTVNLGIFSPELFEITWSSKNKNAPSVEDCPVSLRLGDLMQGQLYGEGLDKWWTVKSTEDCWAVGDEIAEAIENHAVPFFEKIKDLKSLAEHLSNVKGWQSKNELFLIFRGIAEWKIGKPALANETLKAVKSKAWSEKARKIEQRILNGKHAL